MRIRLGTPPLPRRAPRRTTVAGMSEDTRRRRLLGVCLALVSAASFGVMPVLTKVVYDDGAEPIGVLAVRFSLAQGCCWRWPGCAASGSRAAGRW